MTIAEIERLIASSFQSPLTTVSTAAERFKEEGNIKDWFDCCKYCADTLGDEGAAYDIGIYFFQNDKPEQAIEYMQLSASKDCYGALLFLGDAYREGYYFQPNFHLAVVLYERAAQNAMLKTQTADAYQKISITYRKMRDGTPEDSEAYRDYHRQNIAYLKKAIAATDGSNLSAESVLLVQLSFGTNAGDKAECGRMCAEAIQQRNDPIALTLMAEFYAKGDAEVSIPKDYAKAIDYLDKAEREVNENGEFWSKNDYNVPGIIESCHDLRTAIQPSQKKQGGCYVATCVYGSYDCPPVWSLRRFRDEFLLEHPLGRVFVKTYYAISPTMVKKFGHTAWFNTLFRSLLTPLVCYLNRHGISSDAYRDPEAQP